jgi:hypothetical protein
MEHTFDASWAIPIEVLSRLNELLLVRSSLGGATLGTIALLNSFLRIIDYTAITFTPVILTSEGSLLFHLRR